VEGVPGLGARPRPVGERQRRPANGASSCSPISRGTQAQSRPISLGRSERRRRTSTMFFGRPEARSSSKSAMTAAMFDRLPPDSVPVGRNERESPKPPSSATTVLQRVVAGFVPRDREEGKGSRPAARLRPVASPVAYPKEATSRGQGGLTTSVSSTAYHPEKGRSSSECPRPSIHVEAADRGRGVCCRTRPLPHALCRAPTPAGQNAWAKRGLGCLAWRGRGNLRDRAHETPHPSPGQTGSSRQARATPRIWEAIGGTHP
jgi:hypothetical protein